VFAAPGGAIFKDMIIGVFEYHRDAKLYGGVDFNGRGHVYVEVAIYKQKVYVVDERIFLDEDEIKKFCNKRKAAGVSIEVEAHGYNEGFARVLFSSYKKLGFNTKTKSRRLVNVLGFKIHIDKSRTPKTYKDLLRTVWDNSKSEPMPVKYNDHDYFDSFMHCVHTKSSFYSKYMEAKKQEKIKKDHYRTDFY
jgi:hypothetical protein